MSLYCPRPFLAASYLFSSLEASLRLASPSRGLHTLMQSVTLLGDGLKLADYGCNETKSQVCPTA